MGVSTDGILLYGFTFDEGHSFPWSDYDDFEDWYYSQVVKYVPPFEIYSDDSENGYVNGIEPPKETVSEYYRHKREFEKTNPVPLEVVNYCSGDYPMYALASEVYRCSRGYPEEVAVPLSVDKQKSENLKNFLLKHGVIQDEDEPRWWLCSYWG